MIGGGYENKDLKLRIVSWWGRYKHRLPTFGGKYPLHIGYIVYILTIYNIDTYILIQYIIY